MVREQWRRVDQGQEGKSGEGKVRDDQRGRMEQAGKAMIGKT